MVKKKNKSELVLVGAMVPQLTAKTLKSMAKNEERSVSKIIKKLVEASPEFQEALKEVQAA